MVRETYNYNGKRLEARRLFFLSLALLLINLITLSAAFAEEVFENEYIVTPAKKSGIGIAAILPNYGDSLGQGAYLYHDRNYSSMSALAIRRVVNYNKERDICPKLLKDKIVGSCAPNYRVRIFNTPNDGRYTDLYAHQRMHSEAAWDVTTGSDSIVTAVIDTGVDYTHPDLAENIWTNPGEIPGNNVDDDGNGFVDDVHGYDFLNNDGDPMDDNGHGTHVSGTIAGRGNNGIGVTGVNWRAKVIGVKFLGSDGSGSLSDAIRGINYIVALKNRGVNIRVLNNSWGGGGFVQALKAAIESANSAGLVFVAAAGNEANDNDSNPSYPASYDVPNVISVAAVDKNDNVASFSNYGAETVSIAAPGVSILSTYPGGRYVSLSGTSMATPHVVGALTLFFSIHEGASISDAKAALLGSGDQLATLAGVVSSQRRVNLARLIYGENVPLPPPPPTPVPCTYNFESIAYSPDTSADTAEIISQADEDYTQVNLPFAFQFFSQMSSQITLSSNGVIYVNKIPATIDFQPGSSAPAGSIAALHADLVANADPYGIRIAKKSDRVTVYWKMKHYKSPSGEVEIRTTLYSSGVIESFIQLSEGNIASLVRDNSMIGVTSSDGKESYTYAGSGSSLIASGTAVRMTPYCADGGLQAVKVQRLKVKSASPDGVLPGARVALLASGSGSGELSLGMAIDGVQCLSSKTVVMNSGKLTIKFSMPKKARRKVQFTLGGVLKAVKFSRAAQIRSSKRKPNYEAVCNNLLSSIR